MEANSQRPIAVTIPMTRKLSGLGNTTIWKLIAEKKLDTVRVEKRRLVLYDSLERLLTPAAEVQQHVRGGLDMKTNQIRALVTRKPQPCRGGQGRSFENSTAPPSLQENRGGHFSSA